MLPEFLDDCPDKPNFMESETDLREHQLFDTTVGLGFSSALPLALLLRMACCNLKRRLLQLQSANGAKLSSHFDLIQFGWGGAALRGMNSSLIFDLDDPLTSGFILGYQSVSEILQRPSCSL